MTRSTAFQITRSQINHLKKLGQIHTAKTTTIDFDNNNP